MACILSPYFTWWSDNAKARATANVSDAQASDGRVLRLLLPKRTSEGSFFTYFNDGSDSNGDGLADNSSHPRAILGRSRAARRMCTAGTRLAGSLSVAAVGGLRGAVEAGPGVRVLRRGDPVLLQSPRRSNFLSVFALFGKRGGPGPYRRGNWSPKSTPLGRCSLRVPPIPTGLRWTARQNPPLLRGTGRASRQSQGREPSGSAWECRWPWGRSESYDRIRTQLPRNRARIRAGEGSESSGPLLASSLGSSFRPSALEQRIEPDSQSAQEQRQREGGGEKDEGAAL